MKNRKPIKSVRIALDLIEELSDYESASAETLADRMEMPRSTVHDYLRTLSEEGYVLNDDGQYRLSYRLLNLGGKQRSETELFQTARTELRDLANVTGAHANLVVEERGFGVVLATMSGDNTLNALTHDGTYFYLHAAASGKAILAHYPEERVDAIIDRRGLKPLTKQTITDREKLKIDLKTTRERGYSIDSEEIVQGMRGIGTPILDLNADDVVGAVSLYTPVKRPNWEDLAEELLEVSNIIEVEFADSPRQVDS